MPRSGSGRRDEPSPATRVLGGTLAVLLAAAACGRAAHRPGDTWIDRTREEVLATWGAPDGSTGPDWYAGDVTEATDENGVVAIGADVVREGTRVESGGVDPLEIASSAAARAERGPDGERRPAPTGLPEGVEQAEVTVVFDRDGRVEKVRVREAFDLLVPMAPNATDDRAPATRNGRS